MAQYDIPPNTNEEEKAIGGMLTFVQFFWLLGGAVLGAISYILIYGLIKLQIIAIPIGLILVLSGIPFAFVKKHEMPLFKYIMTKRKFDKKIKKLINKRSMSK